MVHQKAFVGIGWKRASPTNTKWKKSFLSFPRRWKPITHSRYAALHGCPPSRERQCRIMTYPTTAQT